MNLSKNKCFEEHKGEDGKCHGLYGGDRFTDYLSYGCIGCKHLDLIVRNKKEDKKAEWKISECGELFCPFCGYCAQFDDDNYCGHCGAKLDIPKGDNAT